MRRLSTYESRSLSPLFLTALDPVKNLLAKPKPRPKREEKKVNNSKGTKGDQEEAKEKAKVLLLCRLNRRAFFLTHNQEKNASEESASEDEKVGSEGQDAPGGKGGQGEGGSSSEDSAQKDETEL